MAEKEKYVAVTIGPILDTINLASSPSALWAASYMMSTLSKNICSALIDSGVTKEDIISPYFDPESELLNRNDGVGLFHDRVIFKVAENYSIEDFCKIRENAIKKTIKYFGFDEKLYDDYFKDYFLVSAVLLDDTDNPIMDSGVKLDCLELSRSFVTASEKNPILSVFNSEETPGGRNDKIKNTVTETMGIKCWQLLNSNRNIRSLGDIANACCRSEDVLKKNRYYAVVRSDGDRISKIIAKLNPSQTRVFSKACLEYCSKIANLVRNSYGGAAIYSGGDDLLALMPVENHNGKTVFDFTVEANELFINSFSDNKEFKKAFSGDSEEKRSEYEKLCKELSLSFGIFVSFYKFPLYEALESSAGLLFGTAKSVRNCTAIVFQKHSGQSEGLLIPNKDMHDFVEFLKECVGSKSADTDKKSIDTDKKSAGHDEKSADSEEKSADTDKKSADANKKSVDLDERVILSSLHKFELFETLFNYACGSELKNLFVNTFDADSIKVNEFLHTKLYEYFRDLKAKTEIVVLAEDEEKGSSDFEKLKEAIENASRKDITSEEADDIMTRFRADRNNAKNMNYILRIIKFFKEKAGEGE